MRFIHCGDIHLDSALTSGLTKEQAAMRNRELLTGFVRMVKDGAKKGVRGILIAGDLFDRKQIRRTTIHVISGLIDEHPDIDFFYLKGNHDPSVFIDSYHGKLPDNLKLFSDSWTSYNCEDVVITGAELDGEDHEALFASLRLDPLKTNILMLHGQVINANGPARKDLIPLRSLQNRYIDYMALGHIHSFRMEALDDRGSWCYSGCLEGRGFDECGEKGYVLLDVEQGNVSAEFVPMSDRMCHQVEVDVSDAMTTPEILHRIRYKLKGIPGDDLVKIVLCGRQDAEAEKDIDFLEEQLKSAYYHVRIKDETGVEIDYSSYRLDRSLRGEFIRLINEQPLEEEEKEKLIRRGLQALAGEEI